MDKRGVAFRQIVMVFYLIIAVIVVLTLIQRARYVTSDEEYVDAYSKIVALTINSMLYSDYNVSVNFNIPSVFEVEVFDDKVRVSFEDVKDEYSFIPDNKFKIDIKRDGDKLILMKNERV